MKRWKGLLWKEWMLARPGMAAIALAIVFAVAVVPFLLRHYVSSEPAAITYAFGIASLWLLLLTYMPVLGLFISLGMEMKRPDVWLHSPASLWTLIGAKALFAVLMTVAAFLWTCAVIGALYLLTGGAGQLPEGMKAGWFAGFFAEMGVIVLGVAVMQLAIGFLFWTVYRWLKSYSAWLAVPVTGVLFIAFFWVNDRLTRLDVLNGVLQMGEVHFFNAERLARYSDIGIEVTGTLTIGGFLVGMAAAALCFWAGIVLFGRKVARQ